MPTRNVTQEIYAEECIGDSLGKHNYNILNLEQKLQKFSYLKNLDENILLKIDNDLTFLNTIKDSFISNQRLAKSLSTVKILEKHWKNKNISVFFPINLSDKWEDPDIRCISNKDDFLDIVLKLKKHLYLKYHPSSHPENTKIHFAVPIYNTPIANSEEDYRISERNKSSNLDVFVSNPFSYENRSQNVTISKKSQHINQIQTFIFQNYKSSRWILIDHISTERFNFYPADEKPATIKIDLTGFIYNYNLYQDIITNYYKEYKPGNSIIELNILADCYIGSRSPLRPSVIINNFNIKDKIIINNFGRIYGAGGYGMNGQNAFSDPLMQQYIDFRPEINDGGTALFCGCKITLNNYNQIYAGGGGGAGGISAASVVPPIKSLSVFDPALDDLWCCYKYNIAKSRYESDLANSIIEHKPTQSSFIYPVASYSAGGGGGGGQGNIGGFSGMQGYLEATDREQKIAVGSGFDGTDLAPGAGGPGARNENTTSTHPADNGGTGGKFGEDGGSSYASNKIGGYGGFAIQGYKNITFSTDINSEMIGKVI